MPGRSILLLLSLITLVGCGSDASDLTGPGLTVRDASLPVAGAVYRGDEPHVFIGGQVSLFCGTHGVFSSAVAPPQQVGQTVLSEYTARFVGDLSLEPPAVSAAATYSLDLQARMAERITLSGTSGATSTFDVELVTFELQGTAMPSGIMVRESPDLASAGVTTITTLSGGQSRVMTHYDVWLDVSLDSGRTWDRAERTVRMALEPS
jgi:hypothetical protein